MKPQTENKIYFQEQLEQRVLHGLACEWDVAQWALPKTYQGLMRRPLFSLKDMNHKWGHWSGAKREICLNRNLVFNHSWEAVREVLRHEMAHQLTEEVLGKYDEPPHGPTFHRACLLLQADPKASERYQPLDGRAESEPSSPEDKIMVRVKKLMALAESRNRHEAESAMAKAHELLARYNLDLLSHRSSRNFVTVFVGQPALRHRREDYRLAHLLQDFYFIYCLWAASYVLEKGKIGRVLEISGTPENVKIASYVHDFVYHFIRSQWHQYNQGKGLNRHRESDFAVGIVEGFRSKLQTKEQIKGRLNGERGLVKIDDPLLLAYAARRYPHIVRSSRKTAGYDRTVLEDGRSIGKKLIISQGITETNQCSVRLIDNK
ncbi:MAG: DUF2786 domain-containing protein [Deltaproteobacteria bacterium]|nr:DUF2786 domain-containing protein [Deltaproteobacteria bacterium]